MITIKFTSKTPLITLPRELGIVVGETDDEIKIQPEGPAEHALPRVMEFFARLSIPIDTISVSKPNLEDVFAKYTKTTMTDAAGIPSEARFIRRSFQRHAR